MQLSIKYKSIVITYLYTMTVRKYDPLQNGNSWYMSAQIFKTLPLTVTRLLRARYLWAHFGAVDFWRRFFRIGLFESSSFFMWT